ncbi:preprotein translocase subunit YajC [Catenulispora sp. GP43]|uniref:SHOCT domain-containing protein n=1 Tax=Catenulispora sp. GP43 TaxID=3156263 RepID=UPI003510F689
MSHPLLNAFWMIFWFFIWVMWLILLFRIIADIFTDRELSGWGKVGWTLLVLLLPFIGIFIYLIARGDRMAERAQTHAEKNQQAFDDYIRKTAGSSDGQAGTVDQLARLADLKSSGVINDAEFEQAKQKLLAA